MMKENKTFSTHFYISFLSVVIGFIIGFTCLVATKYNYKSDNVKEEAVIGGITIGTDSVEAVMKLFDRYNKVPREDSNSFIFTRDSIGYRIWGTVNETFLVKLDSSGKVYDIYFNSDILSQREVLVVSKKVNNRHKCKIYHKGEDFTISFDGDKTYRVYKEN